MSPGAKVRRREILDRHIQTVDVAGKYTSQYGPVHFCIFTCMLEGRRDSVIHYTVSFRVSSAKSNAPKDTMGRRMFTANYKLV
jgi:hypothetical protein